MSDVRFGSVRVSWLTAAGFAAALAPLPVVAGAFIDNGVVMLGVNDQGNLNVDGGPPSAGDTTTVGLRYIPTGSEATAPGCLCEGWGVADAISGVAGEANRDTGINNIAVQSFSADAHTATSVVTVGSTFRVTHYYHPSASPNLYQVDVTIENISSDKVDVRYRRNMDWDIEPTVFDEYATIQVGTAENIIHTSDDGFASSNPLVSDSLVLRGNDPRPVTFGEMTDSGPYDHGALFDFDFGRVAVGGKVQFVTFYGAAGNETEADAALDSVGAEAYSYGQPAENSYGDYTRGEPNTFIFAFKGIGGSQIFNPLNFSNTASRTVVDPGDQVTYKLCFDNARNEADVTGVTMTVQVPELATFIDASGSPTVEGTQLLWNVGAVAAGAPEHCEQMTLAIDAPRAQTVATSAVLDSNETEPVTRTARVDVVAVGLDYTLAPAGPEPDSKVTYKLCYDNLSGTQPLAASSLTASVPTGLNFVSASGSGAYIADRGVVAWNIGTLDAYAEGQCEQLKLQLAADMQRGAVATSTATLTFTDAQEIDPVVREAVLTVAPMPVTPVSPARPVQPGELVPLEMCYSNQGFDTVYHNVTLTIAIAEGATLESYPDGGQVRDGKVTWDIGTIEANAAQVCTGIVVSVDETLRGSTLVSNAVLSNLTASAVDSTPSARFKQRARVPRGSSTTAAAEPGTIHVERRFTIPVALHPALRFETTGLPTDATGERYQAQLVAAGGDGTYTWAIVDKIASPDLKAWSQFDPAMLDNLSVDGQTGLLLWDPLPTAPVSGTLYVDIAVQVVDGSGDAAIATYRYTGPFTRVADPLAITTADLPTQSTGSRYEAQLAAAGGEGAYTWSLVSADASPDLQAWSEFDPATLADLSLDAATGLLTWDPLPSAPDSGSNYVDITVQVADAGGEYARTTYRYSGPFTSVSQPLTITTADLSDQQVGGRYQVSLEAGGGDGTYTWSLVSVEASSGLTAWSGYSPTMLSSLSVSPQGLLVWDPLPAVPEDDDLYIEFTVRVADGSGREATAVFKYTDPTIGITQGGGGCALGNGRDADPTLPALVLLSLLYLSRRRSHR